MAWLAASATMTKPAATADAFIPFINYERSEWPRFITWPFFLVIGITWYTGIRLLHSPPPEVFPCES